MSIITAFGSTSSELQGDNGAARVAIYDTSGNALSYLDGASYSDTTTKGLLMCGLDHDTVRAVSVSRDGRIEIPFRRLLLSENSEGTTLNTQRWTSTATTMAATQSATVGWTLNSGAITTINTGIAYSSRQTHRRVASGPLHFRARMRSTAVANQEWMAGLVWQATLSATAVVDAGAMWKFGTDGTIKPAVWGAGAEVSLGSDITSSLSSTNYYDYHVLLDDDHVTFQVFRSDTGLLVSRQTIQLALTSAKLITGTTHVYTYIRLRNSGSAPASGGQLFVTEVDTLNVELTTNVPYTQQAAGNALHASVNPTAITQAAQNANSVMPTAATLSNTSASYSTLGGYWQFAAVASATTDYSLFGYQVPTPYRFWFRGARIEMWNTGAANAATPATTLVWGIGLNGASANLATGGHIRRLIGSNTIGASAVVGAGGTAVEYRARTPLPCEPGTFFSIMMRVAGGAATASQVIQGFVDIDGDFE